VGLGLERSHGDAAKPVPLAPNTPQVIVMVVSYTSTVTVPPAVTSTPSSTPTPPPLVATNKIDFNGLEGWVRLAAGARTAPAGADGHRASRQAISIINANVAATAGER